MEARRTGHVAFGKVRRVRDGEILEWDPRHALDLLDDLGLGKKVERYGRTWISGPSGLVGRNPWARIGFQSSAVSNEIWDEEMLDFREIDGGKAGASAPFLVRAADGRMAFQIRPGLIRRAPYAAAVQLLLNAEDNGRVWRVSADLAPQTWEEWLGTAGKIKQLKFRLNRPNPNWVGREKIEEIVDGAGAEFVNMVLNAPDGEGLEINDAFVAQALDHTVDREYGSVVAKAEGSATPIFDSSSDEAPPEHQIVISSPGSRNVSPRELDLSLEWYDEYRG